ncbi:hypothetical protein FDT66_13450 [Polaribacter aestuariivivens]|uniref:Threonine synthase n=1 Tax=Polaribacter aestuariivivens TaxID=2304626 RepID=A0A5S3N6X4_9FLAO|nr:DUF6503 family protein [Polaribacter aestuariivivens]TMM28606.1 hypothetical protein FDT66_13450 [Polaribacter aestuariivivens]
MKKIILLFLAITVISCKNDSKKESQQQEEKNVQKENFPENLAKVFEAHGGINTWRKSKVLSFNKGEEVHTVDLQTRKTVVNSPKYSLGFDGKEVWLDEEEEGIYKGNLTFYYNLYFYFYAMPFVLADDGIIYNKVADLTFEGKNYPGYKISYKANVGTSPDDNYIIYYNPTSFQMEWLAYTVTFNSKETSNKYNLIRYNSWENTNGLILPKEITWYKKDENGNPTEPARPATEFTLPLVSEGKLADSFYEKPVK